MNVYIYIKYIVQSHIQRGGTREAEVAMYIDLK